MFALFEGFIKFHFTDGRTQRGLRQLRNSGDVIAGSVRGQHRIRNLEIQHTVDLQLRIVLGNTDLTRQIQRHFLQHMSIGDTVDKGHHDIQPRQQSGMKFTQALDHPGVLLRYHFYRLEDKYQSNKQNKQCYFHDRNSPS